MMYFVVQSSTPGLFWTSASFLSQPKTGRFLQQVLALFLMTWYERGPTLQYFLPLPITSNCYTSYSKRAKRQHPIWFSFGTWPSFTYFLPSKLSKMSQVSGPHVKGMTKTQLHVCVYISVYIGALWCIYFCLSGSVLFMCCSGTCIGQALALQTPHFFF